MRHFFVGETARDILKSFLATQGEFVTRHSEVIEQEG
jgi:hypothetical protein